jgi:hypothetical protein
VGSSLSANATLVSGAERHQRDLSRVLARQTQDCVRRMLVGHTRHGLRKADIAQAIAPMHKCRIFFGQTHQRCRTTREDGRLGVHQIHQRARVAHRVRQTDVTGRDAQSKNIGMGVRHHDRQGVVHAGVGIDQKLWLAHQGELA